MRQDDIVREIVALRRSRGDYATIKLTNSILNDFRDVLANALSEDNKIKLVGFFVIENKLCGGKRYIHPVTKEDVTPEKKIKPVLKLSEKFLKDSKLK